MTIQHLEDRKSKYSFEEEPEQNKELDEEEYIQEYHVNTHEKNQIEDENT